MFDSTTRTVVVVGDVAATVGCVVGSATTVPVTATVADCVPLVLVMLPLGVPVAVALRRTATVFVNEAVAGVNDCVPLA